MPPRVAPPSTCPQVAKPAAGMVQRKQRKQRKANKVSRPRCGAVACQTHCDGKVQLRQVLFLAPLLAPLLVPASTLTDTGAK